MYVKDVICRGLELKNIFVKSLNYNYVEYVFINVYRIFKIVLVGYDGGQVEMLYSLGVYLYYWFL